MLYMEGLWEKALSNYTKQKQDHLVPFLDVQSEQTKTDFKKYSLSGPKIHTLAVCDNS